MLSFLRKKMKTIMVIVAVLFAATMFYGLSYKGIKGVSGPKKNSIATVNGREIDHKRFEQVVNRLFSQNKERLTPEDAMLYQTIALQQVIDFTIMLDEAKKNFGVSGGEVDQAIDQIIQANKIPSKSALEEALSKMGQDYSQFRESIKQEILVSKMANRIKGGVAITPDDLREVKASHILIMLRGNDAKADFEARSTAEQLLARIKKGESFSALAMKYSDDLGSKANRGELGWVTTGTMVPEFEKALFSLKPGQMSGVVKTPYGYHIIKVEDTKLRSVKEKGKDLNEVVLAEKQDQVFRKWVLSLKEKAKIEVNDPLLMAQMLVLNGKMNDAISSYNQALIDNPTNPYIHLFLGNAYTKVGNKEFAMLEYEKASQMSAADPSLLISLGDIYRSLNKNALGLEQYRKASIVAGDNKKMHEELKSLFKKYGSKSDVAKEQAEITRLEKKEKFEKEIQERLK